MNLFYLDNDVKKCAEYHCDKHVIKMLLELVQMLYTAHHCLKSELPPQAYKISHKNHPVSVWVRSSMDNYDFTTSLALCLATEYTYRYNKIHSCEKHAMWLSNNKPKIPDSVPIPFPLAMPDNCKCIDTITSYRKYYRTKLFAKWTKRPTPPWFYHKSITSFFN